MGCARRFERIGLIVNAVILLCVGVAFVALERPLGWIIEDSTMETKIVREFFAAALFALFAAFVVDRLSEEVGSKAPTVVISAAYAGVLVVIMRYHASLDDRVYPYIASALGAALLAHALLRAIVFYETSVMGRTAYTRINGDDHSASNSESLREPLVVTVSARDDEGVAATKDDLSDETKRSGAVSRAMEARERQRKVDEARCEKRGYGTSQLLELTKPHSRMLWISCCVLLVRLPLSLSIPHWVAETIGALSDGDYERANWNVGYLVACGTGDAILDFWVYFLFGLVQQRIIRDLRLELFRAILRQEIGYFDSNQTGEITSRLVSDCAEMANDLTWVFRFTLEASVRIGGTVVYMLVRSWRLGLLALAIVPVTAIVNRYYSRFLHTNQKKVQSVLAKANVVATECVSSIRLVRSFAAESREGVKYRDRIRTHFQTMMRQIFYTSCYFMFCNTFLINTCVQGAILAYGGYLVQRDLLSTNVLLAFMLYQGILQEYTQNLLNSFTSLIKSSGAAAKVFDIIDRVPRCQSRNLVEEDDDGTKRDGASPSIIFENVHFCYPSRCETEVLRGIDLHIKSGTTTAIVGCSGAGKSTLFHLLEHFYEPQIGRVLVGGISVSKYTHARLHAEIALVSQEPTLMAGTVMENILYGVRATSSDSAADDETRESALRSLAVDAAKKANAHGFITSELERGYETEVGENGAQLSGGQRQRIALARCIACQPRVLLLDEATSALDAESEAIVQDALNRAMKGRTTLVIAHRLSTVRNADTIVVMHEGRIVQIGTHDELMKVPEKRGVISYRGLVQRQLS
eukprot:g2706.t1